MKTEDETLSPFNGNRVPDKSHALCKSKMKTIYIGTFEMELRGSTEISSSVPETDIIVEWATPPQTLMKAGLADIASMMHKIYAEQSPELCKALQSAA